MTAGALKSPNNVASTFFNTVHLLPKDVSFEHGSAKLAFLPRAPWSNLVTPLRVSQCQFFGSMAFTVLVSCSDYVRSFACKIRIRNLSADCSTIVSGLFYTDLLYSGLFNQQSNTPCHGRPQAVGQNGHLPSLEIGTKNQPFLENILIPSTV